MRGSIGSFTATVGHERSARNPNPNPNPRHPGCNGGCTHYCCGPTPAGDPVALPCRRLCDLIAPLWYLGRSSLPPVQIWREGPVGPRDGSELALRSELRQADKSFWQPIAPTLTSPKGVAQLHRDISLYRHKDLPSKPEQATIIPVWVLYVLNPAAAATPTRQNSDFGHAVERWR